MLGTWTRVRCALVSPALHDSLDVDLNASAAAAKARRKLRELSHDIPALWSIRSLCYELII
jgi:hypothetical protein